MRIHMSTMALLSGLLVIGPTAVPVVMADCSIVDVDCYKPDTKATAGSALN
jgi:hypothetical protein